VPGADTLVQATITGDAAYPNPAGYPLTPDQFGLKVLKRVIELQPATVAAAVWTPVAVKTFNVDGSIASVSLHLVVGTTGVEVANGVNVSTAAHYVLVEGN
jgi:hypothetical protein